VLGPNNSGSFADISAGIIWAVDHGADVINLSLGGPQSDPVLTAAVNYAIAKQVVVVASAGNSHLVPDYPGGPVNATEYPAAIPGVITVGSTQYTGSISDYSQQKSYVAVAAPGQQIASTWSSDASPYQTGYNRYLSGTSMASPYVAAAAALLLARKPELSPAAVAAYITATADDAGASGRDSVFGYGHLNAGRALDQVIANRSRATTLSVAPSSDLITANSTVKLTATFSSNGWRLSHRTVSFQKYVAGAWKTIGSGYTNGSGKAAYSTAVGVHTKFRAVAAATTGLGSAVATSVTVRVKAKVAISGSSPSADRVTVTSRMSPGRAVKASLQRMISGVWRTVSSRTTSTTGAVTFSSVSAPTGSYPFRVVVGSSSVALGGISNTIIISVR
jgi:hypothetical protein